MCVSFFIGDIMDEIFMKEALEEAKKAYFEEEVPIGCVIVKDNQIIARAHNQKEKFNCSTKHAEIIAIEEACYQLKTWHLDDCTIYVTVEPCVMCVGAIIQSHMHTIVYGTENEKFGAIVSKYNILNPNKYKVKSGFLCNEITHLMNSFFKDKR